MKKLLILENIIETDNNNNKNVINNNERFPKDGFNDAFNETRKTLIKDIFPRFGNSNEFKMLYELKKTIITSDTNNLGNKNNFTSPFGNDGIINTNEQTLTSYYASSSFMNNTNIWIDILPKLDVLKHDETLCNICHQYNSTTGCTIASSSPSSSLSPPLGSIGISKTKIVPQTMHYYLFKHHIITLNILLSDESFYKIFEKYLTKRYCCEHLKCYRCILIYILNYKKGTKETFQRCMYIYINFISGKGIYEVCVPPNIKTSIEYKLAHPNMSIFNKLMDICFIEMENCLSAIDYNLDSNATCSSSNINNELQPRNIEIEFANMIWKNIQQRLLMSGSSGEKRSSMIMTMAKDKDQSRSNNGNSINSSSSNNNNKTGCVIL